MDLDLEKCLVDYNNVTREELEKIRDSLPSQLLFNVKVRLLHEEREKEKKYGKASFRTGPLVHVLSVTLQPNNQVKPLSVYGRINAQFRDSYGMVAHEIYNRDRHVAELLTTTNTLTLTGPDSSCSPQHASIPLFGTRINVILLDAADDTVFVKNSFFFDDTEIGDGYGKLNSKVINSVHGSLTINYIAIPFAVNCRIQLMIKNRKAFQKREFVNVFGKIAVNHGNYFSEETSLFEKQDNDFQRVEIDNESSFHLTRCWVAVPANSPFVVSVDLSEFETRQNIVKDTTEFLVEQGWGATNSFVVNDFFIRVHMWWFFPEPFGRDYHCLSSMRGISTEDIEEMDTEGEDEPSDDESHEALSSDLKSPWSLQPHKSKPWPSPAIEIFSVFIGRENSKAIKVYGSIEVLMGEYKICYIFNRNENDAFGLSGYMKSAPILDGSRVFKDFTSLEMKFDIKDVDDSLAIKGYVEWDASVLDSSFFHEKQLCSFIQGQHGGFAAVHYSIFSEAVAANIKVFLNLKRDVYHEVWGSLVTHYNCYNYSSQYNKDHYQIVLFGRNQDDSIKPNADGAIPLSRSMVIVPSYSSLIFSVGLSFGISGQNCAEEIEVEIGIGCKTIETNDFIFRIVLDWCEIK